MTRFKDRSRFGAALRIATFSTAIAAGGCSDLAKSQDTDEREIMGSLVSLLTTDNKPVCLDGATRGRPLAIFRTMMEAPEPARRPLAWYTPQPLRPAGMLSDRTIVDDQIRSDRVVLPKPQQGGQRLSDLLQGQLNTAAHRLSFADDDGRVAIPEMRNAKLATSRWWLFNRIDRTCSPIYTVSNPVIAKNVAFLTVTAGHWGTTYAFQKQQASWAPIAQWSNWLY